MLFPPATHNDVMHAVVLLAPRPSTQVLHTASSALARCQLFFFVNLRTDGLVQVPQTRGRQRFLINAYAMLM